MPKIFISYRRADTKAYAGRLYDRLVQEFGKANVFIDVDTIPAGTDFRGVLREAVNTCDVILVLIGSQWLTIKDEYGNRRLDDPDDFVRLEVETGLQRLNAKVIPLYVDGTPAPKTNQLPSALSELASRNGLPLRDNPDFDNDVARLTRQIRAFFPAELTKKSIDWAKWGVLTALLIGILTVITALAQPFIADWLDDRDSKSVVANLTSTPTSTDTPTQTLTLTASPTPSATQTATDEPTSTDEPTVEAVPPTNTLPPTETIIPPTASFTRLPPTLTNTTTFTPSPTVLPSLTPTLRPTIATQDYTGQVIDSSLNQLKVIYPFPSYGVNPTISISPNTLVKIISCELRNGAQWHNIEFGNPIQTGWIPTEYLVQPVHCP